MRLTLLFLAAGFLMLASFPQTAIADDADVSGKWSGTWATGQYTGSCTFDLTLKEQDITGEVNIFDRTTRTVAYTAPVKGSVKGRIIKLNWDRPVHEGPRSLTVYWEAELSQDGTLTGTASGPLTKFVITITVKRSQ